MKTSSINKLIVSCLAMAVLTASLPVQAARKINYFNLGRDVIVQNASSTSGDYVGLSYSIVDPAGLTGHSVTFQEVDKVNDVVRKTGGSQFTFNSGGYYGSGNLIDFTGVTVPQVAYWGPMMSEYNASLKIDPDQIVPTNSVAASSTTYALFRTNSIYRVYLNVNAGVPVVNKYVHIMNKPVVNSFSFASAKTIKQNGATTTGDFLTVRYSVSSSTNVYFDPGKGPSYIIALPLNSTTYNIDADLLPKDKSTAVLKAVTKVGTKQIEAVSARLQTSVLAMPKISKYSVDDNASQTGTTPTQCDYATTNTTGDNKLVFKWDVANVTELRITDGKDGDEYLVQNPNGTNKSIAIDVNCFKTKGARTITVEFENTAAYQGTTITKSVTVN